MNLVTNEFAVKFKEQAGHDNQLPWAANAYDFTMLLGERLSKVNTKLESKELIALFKKPEIRNGVGGEYKITYEKGIGFYFNYDIAIKQIKGEQIINID